MTGLVHGSPSVGVEAWGPGPLTPPPLNPALLLSLDTVSLLRAGDPTDQWRDQ